MLNMSKRIAKLLITLECVQLSPEKPFLYASGLKGPIYTDNRKLLSNVSARDEVCEGFVQLIKDNALEYDSIAGMATAGIAHAALVSNKLLAPMVYVRSKPKGHGRQNQVEGSFNVNEKLILIEDLVNQGKSLGEGVDGVRNAQLIVEDCLTIVDYQMQNSVDLMKEKKIKLYSLTNFETLVETAKSMGRIDDKSEALLLNWQKNPTNWQL